MTNKDEANTPQRLRMEQRWENARKACGEGSCHSNYRFHVAGCERRAQKIKVTNLNTGETSEVTIVHSDFHAVKEVLEQHDKQAVRLEPVARVIDLPDDGGKLLIPAGMDFDQEYWSQFEKGYPAVREYYDTHDASAEMENATVYPIVEAPARPWWKFWGRRG